MARFQRRRRSVAVGADLTTRRDFVTAGGLALAGLAGLPMIGRRRRRDETVVEIHMRSDLAGGDVWFDPVGVSIRPGQTVRWIVRENVHTATAYHPDNAGRPLRIPPAARPWDSGYLVNPGDFYEVRLDVEGVYDYFCIPHETAGMVGRIVVGNPTASPAAAPDGLPPAVRQALPSVEQIVRTGSIHLQRERS